jgi:hypothetical protein
LTWLKQSFGVGIKDLCVYWFRKAHQHLSYGQRAGLVGTNSVAMNKARSASLQYIVDNGGVITDAVSTQRWPGEAKVHVSLINWIKGEPHGARTLDGVEVSGIDSSLHVDEGWTVQPLPANKGRCFQGAIPVGEGFVLTSKEAESLLMRDDADYADVIRPYLKGEDLPETVDQQPRRWIIDFDSMALEAARAYPDALAIVRERVKSEREQNADPGFQQKWWRLGRPRVGMRRALRDLNRFAAAGRVGKRLLASWYDLGVLPNDKAQVFAFDDDFSMGVVSSGPHTAWAWARSGKRKADLSYTPTSVFMTFPWPDSATAPQREAVAAACRRLLARRSELCLAENIGLTKLYNAMDEGAYADLKALHRELDEAVADCYGWPKSIAQDDAEIVTRMTELNRQISTGEREYHPFAYLDSVGAENG